MQSSIRPTADARTMHGGESCSCATRAGRLHTLRRRVSDVLAIRRYSLGHNAAAPCRLVCLSCRRRGPSCLPVRSPSALPSFHLSLSPNIQHITNLTFSPPQHPACSFASSPDPCELFLLLLSSHRLCLVLLALTFNIFICLPRACRRSRSLSPLNHAPASTCTTRLPQLPVAAASGYRKDHQTRRGSQTLTDLRNLTSPTLRARPATSLRLDRNTSTYPIHATAIGHSSCRIHHCSPFDGAGHLDPAPNAPVKA